MHHAGKLRRRRVGGGITNISVSPLPRSPRGGRSPRSLGSPGSPRSPRSPTRPASLSIGDTVANPNQTSPRSRRVSLHIREPWWTPNMPHPAQISEKPVHHVPTVSRSGNLPSIARSIPDSPKRRRMAAERWRRRAQRRRAKFDAHNSCNQGQEDPHTVNARMTPSKLSPDISLLLCENTRALIQGVKKFDADLSGELSREEFDEMIAHIANTENFRMSRQDLDMLFLAFDDDESGSVSTREIVSGVLHAHHTCPVNILGQRQPPKKADAFSNMTPAGFHDIYSPLHSTGTQLAQEYLRCTPRQPMIFGEGASMRRARFLSQQRQ